MEDLVEIWEKLSLNEEEHSAINIKLGNSEKIKIKGECSLIGKVCSNQTKGKEVV